MTIKEALNVGFPMTNRIKELQVVNYGTTNEYYIDNRTEYEGNFNYIVHILSYNALAYLICCPNCGKLHPFPIGWSDQVASNLWIDHVVIPELLEYDEDGKKYQLTVYDWDGITEDKHDETELTLSLFARSNNPKVKEAYDLLFPECDYSESIDPDAKPLFQKD